MKLLFVPRLAQGGTSADSKAVVSSFEKKRSMYLAAYREAGMAGMVRFLGNSGASISAIDSSRKKRLQVAIGISIQI